MASPIVRAPVSQAMRVLRALPAEGCTSRSAIVAATEMAPDTVSNMVARLIVRRLAERVRQGCYRITPLGIAARDAAPTLDTGRRNARVPRKLPRRTTADRVWWVLRAERAVTMADLLAMLDSGEAPRRRASTYLRLLAACGFLRVDRRRAAHRYVLVRDPGPLAPRAAWARRAAWDPNSRAFVPFEQQGAAP